MAVLGDLAERIGFGSKCCKGQKKSESVCNLCGQGTEDLAERLFETRAPGGASRVQRSYEEG